MCMVVVFRFVSHMTWLHRRFVFASSPSSLREQQIGRLRRNKPPRAYSSSSGMKGGGGGSFNANVAAGRLLCDTYLSAKEFLRETTYRLAALHGLISCLPRSLIGFDLNRNSSSPGDTAGVTGGHCWRSGWFSFQLFRLSKPHASSHMLPFAFYLPFPPPPIRAGGY